MSLEDFEAQTLSHMLKPPSDAATAVQPDQDQSENNLPADMSMDENLLDENQGAILSTNFSAEDRQQLVELVSEQAERERIDWNAVAFGLKGKFTPKECLFEFLKLPISDELQLDIETKTRQKPQPINLDQKLLDAAPENVFLDDANPLLTQLAIYARLLENAQSGHEDEPLLMH